jgi:RNA polymerase sigma factor (sigma-70 family)
MGTRRLGEVIGHLRQSLLPANGGGLTDGQLLARFVAGREEDAFAALLRRHGPMVLGVCRRILGHAQDAEDAFQAAFLILARKAASVAKREAVASFLYGVAYRTAVRARARAILRRTRERQVVEMPHPEVAPAEAQDWRPLLDCELQGLPEKYRAAVVLCDLEGRTRREAARLLRLAEGTLSSRLATARRMLAQRLSRRGLALGGGALATAIAEGAVAAVPAPLAVSTVKAAALAAAGSAAAVSTQTAALMSEVLQVMLLTKLKVAMATAMVVIMLGAGGLVYRAAGQAPAGDKSDGSRSRTELETLRRENDLLKLNLEVVLEKVRAQETELRTLRGKVHAAANTANTNQANFDFNANVRNARAELLFQDTALRHLAMDVNAPFQLRTVFRPNAPALPKRTDVAKEIEAALKLLLEARDAEGQRQATDTLEKAIQKLRKPLPLADPNASAPK